MKREIKETEFKVFVQSGPGRLKAMILCLNTDRMADVLDAFDKELAMIDPKGMEKLKDQYAAETGGDLSGGYMQTQFAKLGSIAATVGFTHGFETAMKSMNKGAQGSDQGQSHQHQPGAAQQPAKIVNTGLLAEYEALSKSDKRAAADFEWRHKVELREARQARAAQFRAQYDAIPDASKRAEFWAQNADSMMV